MDFLKQRRITDFGESQEETGLAFLDLTYTHSNRIFYLLVNEGLAEDHGGSQTLSSFLEVVSFVHCWIEMEVERRVSRQMFEGLGRVLSDIKTSWGTFFAHPQEEPRLENESVDSVAGFMTHRCDQYHASYLSGLRRNGRLHALRTCCAAFLENAIPGYLSQREGSGQDQEGTNNLNEVILHYIGEFVYDLDRDIHHILAQLTS
jgi:hypothetical protein